MDKRLLLLVGVTLLVATFLAPVRPAFAVTVTVPINVAIAEGGAPSFMWTIGGLCTPIPSTGSTGGTVSVSMIGGCAYTINTPADAATQRDRLANGAAYVTSLARVSCSPGPSCPLVSETAHVEELLTIGVNCNGAIVSVVSPTADRWYNYGTSLLVTCNGIWGRASGTGTRATSWNWDGGSNTVVATTSTFTASAQTMNAGHTLNVNIATQYQLTLDSGAAAALNAVTPPTITSDKYWYDTGTSVTYTGNGVFNRASGTGNRSISWVLDAGVPTSLSITGTFPIPAMMTSAHAIHVTTKLQRQVTLNAAATTMLNTITAPTLANDKYWYDTGTSVTLTLNGVASRAGGTGLRLVSYSINGGGSVPVATVGTVTVLNALPISVAESVVATNAVQYQLSLDPGASGALAAITPTPIQSDSYWYDSGTQVVYSGNGVFGRASGAGLRVVNWMWDAGAATPVLTSAIFPASITMLAPHTLHTVTATQFEVALVGTYGISSATPPTVAGDDYWYDSGTVVSLSLQGVFGRVSGVGDRMISYSVNSGPSMNTATSGSVAVLSGLTLTSPQTISVTAVTQFQLTLDPVMDEALNSVTAPTLVGDSYWYDSGSSVIVTANGVWSRTATTGYRLSSYSVNGGGATSVASSGSVTVLDLASISSPQSITAAKVVQFLLSVSGGGGATYSVDPPIAGDTGWYDSGAALKVMTNSTYNSDGGARQRVSSWSIDGGPDNPAGATSVVTTSDIVMTSAHALNFDSVIQYHVLLVVKDGSGATGLTPASIRLEVDGGSQSVTGDEVWVDAGSTVSVVGISWHGVDVAPSQQPSYTISSPQTLTVNARVYDATLVVRDSLGLPVGGADAVITLSNGTVIHVATSGDGSVALRMIPLGTYQASVTNLGTSASVAGDASVHGTAEARVFLSYAVVIAIAALVFVVVLAVVLIRRR